MKYQEYIILAFNSSEKKELRLQSSKIIESLGKKTVVEALTEHYIKTNIFEVIKLISIQNGKLVL